MLFLFAFVVSVVVVSNIFTVTIARGSGKCRLRTSDAPCCGVKEAGCLMLWYTVKEAGGKGVQEAGCLVWFIVKEAGCHVVVHCKGATRGA